MVDDKTQKKKEAYKEMTKIPTEETKNEYRRLKKAAKKAVARAMKEEAVRKISELGRNTNNVFRLVRKMKKENVDVVEGRCMRGNVGTFYLNNKDRTRLWKAHMSRIMNEVNKLDQIADAVEGPMKRVMRDRDSGGVKILDDLKGACTNRGLCRNDSS